MSLYDLQAYASNAALRYGVPQNLFFKQISQESSWNPYAVNSTSGATGIAQFLPSTAANAGYGIAPFNPSDPYASLNAAAQYDAALYNNTGSWNGAMLTYSGGAYSASSLMGGSNMTGTQPLSLSFQPAGTAPAPGGGNYTIGGQLVTGSQTNPVSGTVGPAPSANSQNCGMLKTWCPSTNSCQVFCFSNFMPNIKNAGIRITLVILGIVLILAALRLYGFEGMEGMVSDALASK